MTATNKINLNIDEKALNYAKIYASLLLSEYQRKRAYASIASLYSLINLFEETELDVQKTMTLFRNPVLNEQYEISDLYINDWHIDVRVIIDGDIFLVPKVHFENEIQPDFYAVVKLDSKLSSCELLGFADTEKITKQSFDSSYYSCPISELISYKEFLTTVTFKKTVEHSSEDHAVFKEQFLSLIDDEVDTASKNRILKHLFECNECRTEFCCFTGFEMVSCHMGEYPDLLKDETLNIIAAQDVDNPKYEGKEQIISLIDEKQDEETTQAEEVSDILDELFGVEEESYSDFADNSKEQKIENIVDESNDILIVDDLDTPKESSKENQDVEFSEISQFETISDELEIFDESSNEQDITPIDFEKDDLISNSSVVIDEQPYPHKDLQDDDLFEILETDAKEAGFMDDSESDLVDIKDDDIAVELMDVSEEVLPTLQSDATDEVQKVIVDYDAEGEPIYSYITNVNASEAPDDKITEIVSIDDEIQDSDDWEKEFENQNKEESKVDDLDDEILFEDKDENVVENTSEEIFEENIDYTIDNDDLFADDNIVSYDEEDIQEEKIANQAENTEEDFFDEEEQSDLDTESDFEFNDGIDNENEEYEEYEEDEEDVEDEVGHQQKGGSKKGLLVAFFTIILLAAGGVAFFFSKNINSANNDVVTTENTEVQSEATPVDDLFEQPVETSSNENTTPQETQAQEENNAKEVIPAKMPSAEPSAIEIPTQPVVAKNTTSAPIGNMNKVMSNVFATQNSVTLRGVNWQCAPVLFTNKEFKTYLQGLDDVLKLNIKKNLLNTTEVAQNPNVTVKMAIDNNGQMIKSLISESSGSEQIDNIVLQSINQTLETQKTQILTGGEQKADKYFLQVVVKL